MQTKLISQPLLEKVEETIQSLIPNEDKLLYQAARYAMLNGGKRLRPLISLIACQDMCGEVDHALNAAASLELLHNYTLIHDDLPCMDNDDERRGRPSVHKAFGESLAVLCGDYLLNESYAVILNCPILKPDQKVHLAQRLAHYGGGGQLLEGQQLDLAMTGQLGHIYDLFNIYVRKTSSLFCCALEFAAILSRAHIDTQELLKEVGQKIGLVFQIYNDLDGQEKDREQEKFTILSLQNEVQARSFALKTQQEAIELLEKSSTPFENLIDFINKIFST